MHGRVRCNRSVPEVAHAGFRPLPPPRARSTGRITNVLDTVAVDNPIEAHVATGPAQHTLLGGVDDAVSRYTDRRGFGAAPDLTLAGPVRPHDRAQFIVEPSVAVADDSGAGRHRRPGSGQDQARIGRLIFTPAGRHDTVASRVDVPSMATPFKDDRDAFTGGAAAIYLLTDQLVPDVSEATSFAPQLGLDRNNAPFAPAQGEQVEGGIKVNVPGTDVFLDTAAFDIRQTNVLRPDPVRNRPGQRRAGHRPERHRDAVRRRGRLRLRQARPPARGHAVPGQRHQPARPQRPELPGRLLLPRPAAPGHRQPDRPLVDEGAGAARPRGQARARKPALRPPAAGPASPGTSAPCPSACAWPRRAPHRRGAGRRRDRATLRWTTRCRSFPSPGRCGPVRP